ncbi:MAG: DNA repair protein RadC [Alistipes sp.]|nr:DNA repair protein RadC [Alistipes sp.]
MSEAADRLAARGAEALSDGELLGLVLDDGERPELAAALLESFGGSLAELGRVDLARLRMAGGMGLKRAVRLRAAVELGRRVLEGEAGATKTIRSSDDVAGMFRPRMESMTYEECWCLFLTSSNRIIERQRVSQGGVQGTVVDHRLIVKRALELLATQIVLVHNHPSGTAEPSAPDRTLTDKIARAAALFDIRLLDHLIIARSGDFSFRRAGLLG